MNTTFSQVVDEIYGLEVAEQQELRDILDEIIADARKKEIAGAYSETLSEEKEGKLYRATSVGDAMKFLRND